MKQDREYFGALLDLWAWQKNPKCTYKELLFDLMEMANHWDQAKLARIYPTEFAAYTAWRYSPDGDKFLRDILPEKTHDRVDS